MYPVCVVYVVKKIASFWGLSQLLGVVHYGMHASDGGISVISLLYQVVWESVYIDGIECNTDNAHTHYARLT